MSGFGEIGSGIGDIFAAKGHRRAAQAYDQAERYAKQAAGLEGVSTEIQQMQVERNIYRTIGAQNAALAGAGFESSFDLLSDSQSQGAIDYATVSVQGAINELGQQASAAAYAGQAAAERAMAKGGLFSGIFKIVGGVASMASDRRLKEDIVHIGEWPNGLPMYEFRYKGEKQFYRGVMADDVEKVYPEHVYTMPDGFKAVNYGALGIRMERV